MMKCYIVSKPKAPLELITRPIPTPSENQVLLKELSCVISEYQVQGSSG
jgi:D-arabinose 1-dehydrogenase-like Zn-dependent alcohol dehydrogenase